MIQLAGEKELKTPQIIGEPRDYLVKQHSFALEVKKPFSGLTKKSLKSRSTAASFSLQQPPS